MKGIIMQDFTCTVDIARKYRCEADEADTENDKTWTNKTGT